MTTGWNFVEGDQIAAGRHVLKLLGGGESYEAYLAWDEHLFSVVVAKVVRPDLVDDAITLRALKREVDALGALNHPAIVRGFHAVLDGPYPQVVLENVDGPRLSTMIRRQGPLSPHQLLALGVELCSAVHYLGASEYVHLDIKPGNIIMGSPARLIDLSIARTRADARLLDYAIGTDAYMAPEQCMPHPGDVGHPADIWAAGATLYHAAAGYLPFPEIDEDRDIPELRWPQLDTEPAPLPADVPYDIAKPILAMLAPDPADRPSPGEVSGLLEPLLAALPRPRFTKLNPRPRL
jgi:serine/threonine protein kinase